MIKIDGNTVVYQQSIRPGIASEHLGLIFAHSEVIVLGRKNKRKKKEYRDRLGFNPEKYVSRTRNSPVVHTPVYENAETRKPHRGDIWFADLGCHPGTSIQAGCRPVFIVSNDIGNTYAETLNVLPMTKHLKKPDLPCHTKLNPEAVGDTRQALDFSMVLAEQITTISKLQLRNYVGRVEDADLLAAIDRTIHEQLGLSVSDLNKNDHHSMNNKECDCNDHK